MSKINSPKKLTKAEKQEIIAAYTVTKSEYKELKENFFYHSGLRSSITISPIETESGYFLVTRSDGNGLIQFRDRWKKNKDGSMLFVSSNPASVPLSDIDIINDLQSEIERLREAGRNFLNEHSVNQYCVEQKPDQGLAEENERLKNEIEILKSKLARKGKAGRLENREHKEELHQKIQKLLSEGKGEKEICEELQIGRATYYRHKSLKN